LQRKQEVKMHRFEAKKIIPGLFVGLILFVFSSMLFSQNLEIHYINVQQGQSNLIIGPNGTIILFDGGNEFKGTNEVVPYLQSLGITTTQTLDYIIASHRDTDHYRGLTEVINYGYDALHVYDNGSDKYNTSVQDFLDAAATTTAGGVIPMPLGHVIDLGNGATATCVAVDGNVIGVGAIPGGTANENDRAICLLIRYGGFDYLVTADVGGGADDYACTGRSTSQVNIESPMVQAIMPAGINPMLSAYGVELAHVGHHGSESSCNSDYMNVLTPSVACISVGDGQSVDWDHPRKDVVENVLLAQAPCITAPPALVLQTEEGGPTGESTSFAGYCVGDIVIITDGGNSYTINANGAVSQGPDERVAAGLPATFYFDEYVAADNSPVLYNIHEENVTETSAEIVWSTNEQANSTVKYGTTPGSYPNTVSSGDLELNHQLTLSSLTVATNYYYIVESTDATSNTTTSAEYSFTTGGTPPPKVVFSEVYYDTVGTDSAEEWIELYNDSVTTMDISGWTITDNNGSGATFTIPSGTTMVPGSYLTIAADSVGFNALYGYDADIYGSIPGLNNDGDALILKDNTETVVDTVAWEGGASGGVPAGWGSTSEPNAPTGNTIVRSDPTVDTDTFEDWSVAPNNGDPQTQPTTSTNVVFSEVFYDTPGDENLEEWIELYNNASETVDLSGWTIIDNNGTGSTYTFPSGVTILPGTYLTVARDSGGFTAIYGYEADVYGSLPFLNNSGETIILYDNGGIEVDAVAWEGGASAGIPAGWGSTTDPWASSGNTIVRTNPAIDTDTYADWGYATNNGNPQTQPPSTPVVFSEIFYDTLGDENLEEWIELYNNTSSTVDLAGWYIIDNNGTGWTYTFPSGVTMRPKSYLTIGRDSAGFTAMYGYEADLYGDLPYLNNGGDTLTLYDSENNEIDAVAWEGGASAGVPSGWGSTSDPWAYPGNTIVRIDPAIDTDTYVDWSYATDGGNPQTQVAPGNILFSEVYYDTIGTDSEEEWIELYNNSTFTVNIGGWTITDNNGTGTTFTIPEGETIKPGTLYTIAVNKTGFTALYGYDADLYGTIPSLNNTGDTLILKEPGGTLKDFVAWEGGAGSGIPDGWGSTSDPTASTGNSIVRIDYYVDTDTYADWTWAPDNGFPQTQDMGGPDITPPVISDVQAISVSAVSAVIEWITDEPADSIVEYGTSSGNYTDTVDDLTLVTSHSLALGSLIPGTIYYYRVSSKDEAGNTAVSDEYTFAPPALMVCSISMSKDKIISTVYADAVVTVTSNGLPVEGAVVDITWSGSYGGTDQVITGVNGEAEFRSDGYSACDWSFTITVNNITKGGYVWDNVNSETSETLANDPDGIASYSIFATNSIYLKTNGKVFTGNIGVLDVSPGPWLASNSEVTVGTKVYLYDNVSVYGDKIRIRLGSSISDVYYNYLAGQGTVRGSHYTPLALPLDVTLPTFPVPAPGTQNITIKTSETYTLASGSYGKIQLKPKSTLILTGGTYHLQNLDIGTKSKVLFQAPTEVIIANRLEPGSHSIIGPQEGSGISARDIVIYVNGINGNTGTLGDWPLAATIGTKSTLKANIYVPNGTARIKAYGVAEGAVIAKDVIMGIKVQFTLDSIFY
jgi:beta-lactamase superfamily II metal-dependent hydrolase